MTMTTEAASETIRHGRDRLKMSQEELAARAKVSVRTVSRAERGLASADSEQLLLDLLSRLLAEDPKREPSSFPYQILAMALGLDDTQTDRLETFVETCRGVFIVTE